MVSLVLLQVGCLEQIVTQHTITQSIIFFAFLGSKFQIMTQLSQQDKTEACTG